jgi:lipopolysaccharide assembly protein A
MILSLIIGLILGALFVIFALQNTAIVTITFFSWQLTQPLAFVLLGTLVAGGVVALLVLLPSVMRDEMLFTLVRSERDDLEEELRRTKTELRRRPYTTDTPPVL